MNGIMNGNGTVTSEPHHAKIELPETKLGDVWYFAYGSNMNPKVLTGRRNVHPRGSFACKLDGYVLGFNLYGVPYLEPGMATVTPVNPTAQRIAQQAYEAARKANNGAIPPIRNAREAYEARLAVGLHGIVHLINAQEWEQVKATEGVRLKGIGYQVIKVKVTLYDGQQVEALTLEAAPISTGDIKKFLPSKRYLGLIREGAKGLNLDPAYVEMLDAHPAYEPPAGLSGRLATAAVASMAAGLALPLTPLVAGSIAYKRLSKMIGGSTAAEPTVAPGAMASTALRPNQSSTNLNNGNSNGNGTPPVMPPSDQVQSVKENGDVKQDGTTENASANTSQAAAGASQKLKPAPPPAGTVGTVFLTMREHLDPRVMSVSMMAMFRAMWIAENYVLGPLLGSGKDSIRR